MAMDWVIQANALSAELLRPNLNIYIDISPEISMQRIQSGRNSTELYETLENLRNVREKYIEAFEKLKTQEQIFIVDGNQSPEIIGQNIWIKLNTLIGI